MSITKNDNEDLSENNDNSETDLRFYYERRKSPLIGKKKIIVTLGGIVLVMILIILRSSSKREYSGERGNPIWEAQIKGEWDTFAAADAKDGALIKSMIQAELRREFATDGVKTSNGRILVFIMIAYSNIQRRQLIRSMQMDLYKSYPIDYKFFIGQTPDHYMRQIEHEKRVYNDLIMIPGVQEDHGYASTEKFFANLKYIEQNLKGYNIVCKIDGDAFLNIPILYPQYLEPYLYTKEPTLIARIWDFEWRYQPLRPHINIAFVAMTWTMVRMINRIHEIHFKGYNVHDERRLSHYLKDDIVNYKLIAMPHNISADFDPHEQDLESHAHVVIPGVAYVHELKEEDTYATIAACFDEKGLNWDKMILIQDPLKK